MKKYYKLFAGMFLALLFLSSSVLEAQNARLRYNLAGYEPNASKRMVIMADESCGGKVWTIKDATGAIVLNGTVGTSVTGVGEHTPKAYNHEVYFSELSVPGDYTFELAGTPSVTIQVSNSPYSALAHEVLRVLRVRRSGSHDALDHAYSHGGDASAPVYNHDGSVNWAKYNWNSAGSNVDMLGGWYDAGDYIKFTMTISYTAYNILTAYRLNPEIFDGVKVNSTTQWNDMLDEAKWGLDYLMKTMPDNNTFVIQVGDEADHDQGLRLPENDALNGSRAAFSVKSQTQMALNAAALALGYNVFKTKDLALANTYLAKAEAIYAQAKASSVKSGYYSANTNDFYKDNSELDNFELAAAELYIATQSANYLTDAKAYADAAQGGYWSSWANVNMKANYRLAPYYTVAQNNLNYELDYFNGKINSANNIWNLPHDYVWGSLYSQIGVAASALSHMVDYNSSATYNTMAKAVIDYTFGVNNWGLGFVASKLYPGSIETSYSQIYRLQPSKFPAGEIAEGPAPYADHVPMRQWFAPVHNDNLLIRGTNDLFRDFNTSGATYFEMEGDFVCSETTIGGLSDGLLMLALAAKVYGGTVNPAPVVEITHPVNGQVFEEGVSFDITATASDNSAVSKVDFYIDDVKVGDDYVIPYTHANVILPAGVHTIKAVATDDEGAESVPSIVNISVEADPAPVVEITSPQTGDVFGEGATINIAASATDNGSVVLVEFFANRQKVGEDSIAPYTCSLPNAPIGNYYLFASATDNNGNISNSADVLVNVVDPTPVVTITSPANNATFSEGVDVLIEATAEGVNPIHRVEFFLNGSKVGEDLTFPYEHTLRNLSVGRHGIWAFAIDVENNISDKKEIFILVEGEPLVAGFTVSSSTICEGDEVIFYNTSTGPIDAYSWDFGVNATPATATGAGPHAVIYSTAGVSTPRLTVYNGGLFDVAENQIQTNVCSGSDVTVEFIVGNDWGTGFGGSIVITNTSNTTITDWELVFDMQPTITGAWNCRWTSSKPYHIQNPSWDRNFAPGTSKTIGFNGTYVGSIVPPTTGTFNGQQFTFVTNGFKSAMEEVVTEVIVAPNPATDILNVFVPEVETFNVEIISLSGAVVANAHVSGNNTTLDITDVNPGIYMVVVKANNQVNRTRLIVK